MASMTFNAFRLKFRHLSFCHLKRYISISSALQQSELADVTLEHTNDGKVIGKKRDGRLSTKPEKPTSLKENEKDEILRFFNECDHVTLKKFLKLCKTKRYRFADNFGQCLYTGFGSIEHGEPRFQFEDFDDLLKTTNINESEALLVLDGITKLRNSELKNFGIPSLTPKFTMEDIEKIKYVVGVDIIRNTISWAVMTPERELLETGAKVLDPSQLDYNSTKHHNMMKAILQAIPPSAMYVTQSRIPIKQKSNQKWRPYQVLMEALLKLCLNHRMNLLIPNSSEETYELENYVYHLNLSDLDLFYDVMVNKEIIPLEDMFKQWKDNNDGPLRGMITSLDKYWISLDEDEKPNTQIHSCIFYADMATRCLAKTDSAFPSAYFPKAYYYY